MEGVEMEMEEIDDTEESDRADVSEELETEREEMERIEMEDQEMELERIVTEVMETGENFDQWTQRIRNQLEELSSYLRTGVIDGIMNSYLTQERNSEKESWPAITGLMDYVEKERAKNCDVDPLNLRSVNRLDIALEEQHPNEKIMNYLAELGWEEQLLAYSSRFAASHPGGMARCCERLQMALFDRDFSEAFRDLSPLRAADRLNYFRLGQKIRNENGSTRKNSPSDCFLSFENIIEVERKIGGNDFMDLMLQCIKLKLVDERHDACMYEKTSSYLQLEALHEAVTRLGGTSLQRFAHMSYGHAFERLVTKESALRPNWEQVKKFLRISTHIDLRNGIIYGAEIREEEVDEALSFLINRFLCQPLALERNDVVSALVHLLKSLLNRGASLFFRDPDEKRSSLASLLKYVSVSFSVFPLSDFSPYICCPLTFKSRIVIHDVYRLASLACLAARGIPRSDDVSKLPQKLQSFIGAHQDLRSQVEGGGKRSSATGEALLPDFPFGDYSEEYRRRVYRPHLHSLRVSH